MENYCNVSNFYVLFNEFEIKLKYLAINFYENKRVGH